MIKNKKTKIDYTKPIFVYYIQLAGLSRQRAEENISQIISDFNQIDVQMWFVPINDGGAQRPVGIECIWNPSGNKNNSDSIKKLINETLEIIEGMTSDSELKSKVRNILLSRLLDNEAL